MRNSSVLEDKKNLSACLLEHSFLYSYILPACISTYLVESDLDIEAEEL